MGRKGAEEIEDFILQVKNRYHPDLILLFGSRARNDYLKHSDYDILIVSESFEGIHFLERIYQLLEFWDYKWDVDILPYTPEEFNKKRNQIGIVNEAVKEGIVLEGSC